MPGGDDPYGGGERWAPPEFPRLRWAMGIVGGLTLAAFVYHSLTAASRYRHQQAQKERETRFMGFLHHEEANKRLVNGDLAGAVKHYSKAARFALRGEPGDDVAAAAAAAAGVDPAFIVPDFDAPGAEGWALSLLQRAAAHWSTGDANSCARDCLAVLRVLPRQAASPVDESETISPPTPEASEASEAQPEAGAGVAAVMTEAGPPEQGGEEEKVSKEEEEKRALEKEARMRKDRLERITARATELLGRALAASGQPLAALLALQRCTQARSKRREAALVQFQHLKESLQNALAAENGQSHWPVKVVVGHEGGARGVLVATEEIAEGGEILVEEPFLAAPWSAQDLVQKVYCVHCLRRLAQPDVDGAPNKGIASAPVVAEARSGYCSSVCEAAAWLLHDHRPSSRPAQPAGPSSDQTGAEERTSLYLLAKRVLACLAYGEREPMLQPLWTTFDAAIRSLPTSEAEAKGVGHEHAELQAFVESLRNDVAQQSEQQAGPSTSETGWDASSLVSQLRGGALPVMEQQQQTEGCRGVGLYLLGSHVGRSSPTAEPNARVVFSDADSTLRLVALRPIPANEAVVISSSASSPALASSA